MYGYLAEFLTPIFFIHNGYKIKPLHFYRPEWCIRKGGISFLYRIKKYILRNILFFREKHDTIRIDAAVEVGFKNDGILV